MVAVSVTVSVCKSVWKYVSVCRSVLVAVVVLVSLKVNSWVILMISGFQ